MHCGSCCGASSCDIHDSDDAVDVLFPPPPWVHSRLFFLVAELVRTMAVRLAHEIHHGQWLIGTTVQEDPHNFG